MAAENNFEVYMGIQSPEAINQICQLVFRELWWSFYHFSLCFPIIRINLLQVRVKLLLTLCLLRWDQKNPLSLRFGIFGISCKSVRPFSQQNKVLKMNWWNVFRLSLHINILHIYILNIASITIEWKMNNP